jgi:DNA mismatch endonuclease (patch repair protein)
VELSGYRLSLSTAPGRPDIAFTRQRLALFVHGCFWHRCPYCRPSLPKAHKSFWRRKFELNAERDERKRRQLEAAGWEVLEFWECEVKRDASRCAHRVLRTLATIADDDSELAH